MELNCAFLEGHEDPAIVLELAKSINASLGETKAIVVYKDHGLYFIKDNKGINWLYTRDEIQELIKKYRINWCAILDTEKIEYVRL